jgi:hypothetical protein
MILNPELSKDDLNRLGIFAVSLPRKTDSFMPLISNILFLLLNPETIRTLEGLSPSHLARNLTQVLLAAPSTGGEVSRIFKELLWIPEISFLDDRG